MKVFAAHNKNHTIRATSSAGGVFSILAEDVINSGGVVFGVGFDAQWHPVHICVLDVDDLCLLRGSKYAFSVNSAGAINEAIELLNNDKRVLFSGTPCQIATLKHKIGDNDHLLTVEIVCHGAPESKYWEAYLAELVNQTRHKVCDIEHINFRDKRYGWKNYSFTIKFKDGDEFSQNREDNLYMRAFLQDYTLREACFRCPFKHPDGSKADITLGDLWGITQMTPDIDNNNRDYVSDS